MRNLAESENEDHNRGSASLEASNTQEMLFPFDEEYLRLGVEVFCTDGDSAFFAIETGNTMLAQNGVDGHEYTRLETNSRLPFRESFTRRYEAGRPTLNQVQQFGDTLHTHLTVGACETIAALNGSNILVHLISGGILQALVQVADHAGIPVANIHGVPLLFDGEGNYAGFDPDHVLLDDEGKARTVETIVGDSELRWCHAGDGNGDMLAVRQARTARRGLAVAFAGHAWREWMEDAPIVIKYPDYSPVLPLVTGVERWPVLLGGVHRMVLLRGLGYIIRGNVSFRSDYMPYYEAVVRFVRENNSLKEINSLI